MTDSYGRNISYLRMSVTERCGLRCVYCSKSEGTCLKERELSADKLIHIARAAALTGFDKIRVTGGEPLVRRDIVQIVAGIAAIGKYGDIAMTTNAQLLEAYAGELAAAGLMRVNIGLPSLNESTYRRMTGGELFAALRGMDSALGAGLTPVKINVVLIKGQNASELDDFFAFAREYPVELRFIELMPMGDITQDRESTGEGVDNAQILSAHPELIPLPGDASSPSRLYGSESLKGKIGFISPISHAFCSSCNRLRVTADGFVRPCLGDNTEYSLADTLNGTYEATARRLAEAVKNKPEHHCFGKCFVPDRKMNAIGG